jgi:hypothetical protein
VFLNWDGFMLLGLFISFWNNLISKFSLKSDLLSVKYNSQTNNQETKHPTSARLTHKLACSTNVINMPILRAKTKHRTSLYCLVLCWKSQGRKQGNDAFIRMHFLHFYHAALNWDSQMRWHYNHKCLRILAFTSTRLFLDAHLVTPEVLTSMHIHYFS